MARRNKHAARFGGDFWRIPTYADVDPRKVARALRSFRPVVARMTQTIHAVRDRWTFAPHIANMAAPTVAELEAGTPIRVTLTTGETLDGQLAGPAYDTRYARSSQPLTWTTSPTITWGGLAASPDILDRIGDTLLTYDSQHATGEQPWPYREF